jgi:cytochrome c oxidase subunit 3
MMFHVTAFTASQTSVSKFRHLSSAVSQSPKAFLIFKGNTAENFHLVAPSPWPILTAHSTFAFMTATVAFMHGYLNSTFFAFTGLVTLVVCMSFWFRDVVREATFEGQHTARVQLGLRLGMILFIISEVMFFFAFFWAFFHSSLSPAIQIGAVWPPKGIETLNAFDVPFLNTVILLSSGATATFAHHSILAGNRADTIYGLIATIVLALIFTGLQYFEYVGATFTIADSVYGSCFFLATGFHGFHVIVGTLFLLVCLGRLISHHFTKEHHFGLEAALWYWHFVDVVWLFLFITIYYWGN